MMVQTRDNTGKLGGVGKACSGRQNKSTLPNTHVLIRF